MKLSEKENKAISDAIDQIQEGFNTVIEHYNEAEADKSLIIFSEEVEKMIQEAKQTLGDEFVDTKINTLVKEVLAFIPKE